MPEDFYDLLNVPPDASQDEIKVAFREQVRIYHPDLNDDDRAQAQFTALKTAYDVLGDPVERQAYDRLGHVDYVAKRTSGLPSPDKWASDDGSSSKTSRDGSSVRTKSGSWRGSASTNRSSGTATGTATAGGSGTRSGSNEPWSDRVATGIHLAEVMSEVRRRILRRWHSLNVAVPLLWLATGLYVFGLVRYYLANENAVSALRTELLDTGLDVGSFATAISAMAQQFEPGHAYVSGLEPVTVPLEPTLWYLSLACIVVTVLGLVLGWRLHTRGEVSGPVTIDETIVLAIALGGTSVLVGGPFLAGSLLLPLFYGVVIYHSRRIPGWSPTYLYLIAVSTPLGTLIGGLAGLTTGLVELLAFFAVPLLGAIGLPVRFVIRRRFGI